jgi:hypothetical protein
MSAIGNDNVLPEVKKNKRGGYRVPKRMTKDEFATLVKAEHTAIRAAGVAFAQLADKINHTASSDFNFTTLEAVKGAIEALGGVRDSLDKLQEGCIIRAKSRLAEEL